MKKKVLSFVLLVVLVMMLNSCTLPIIGDFIESDESLGKTNNTAVTIAEAMKDYLVKKNRTDLSLYGIEMNLNSDGNGTVKLYYSKVIPEKLSYSAVYVAEVDSTTGHVERFSKADYSKDGLTPYQAVSVGIAFDAGSLPIDSEKAVSLGVHSFAADLDFHYDYVQIILSAPNDLEQYDIRYISMLNDKVYYAAIDAVSGSVISTSIGALENYK